MANRYTTAGDVTTYSGTYPFIEASGQIILDENEITSTRQSFHNIPNDWPNLGSGVTVPAIFIKNPAEGSIWGMSLTGTGTPWGVGTSINPVKVRFLDQVTFTKDERNTNSYLLRIADAEYLDIDGRIPGSYEGFDDPSGVGLYPESLFGVIFNKENNLKAGNNLISVEGIIYELSIKNIYSVDGFASIRLIQDNGVTLRKVSIGNCFFGGGNGEGWYIGNNNGNYTEDFHAYDCVVFASGAEQGQVRAMHFGTKNALIENCVFVYGALDWTQAFQSGQANSIQSGLSEGGITYRNCIIYGWGNNAVNLTNEGTADFLSNLNINFDNCLITDGLNRHFILNYTVSGSSTTLNIQRCSFGDVSQLYATIVGGVDAGTADIRIFKDVPLRVHDNTYLAVDTFLAADETTTNTTDWNNSTGTIDAPSFVKSGLSESPQIVKNWGYEVSPFYTNAGNQISYSTGDIVQIIQILEDFTVNTGSDLINKTAHDYSNGDRILFDPNEATLPSGLSSGTLYYVINANANDFQVSTTSGGSAVNITTTGTGNFKMVKVNNPAYGRWYKSNTNHNATESTRPDTDTTNWTVLTWDLSGVRSDEVGHASGDTQSYFPPSDFRLTSGSTYEALGRKQGLSFGPTAYTEYQWQESTDGGTTWNDIPLASARNSYFDYTELGYIVGGNMYRCKITPRDASSTGAVAYSSEITATHDEYVKDVEINDSNLWSIIDVGGGVDGVSVTGGQLVKTDGSTGAPNIEHELYPVTSGTTYTIEVQCPIAWETGGSVNNVPVSIGGGVNQDLPLDIGTNTVNVVAGSDSNILLFEFPFSTDEFQIESVSVTEV